MEAPINTDLTGKTALVCGASQGIGAAAAQELASMGCRIIAHARRAEVLEQLIKGLPGDDHRALAMDIGDRAALAAATAELAEELGGVHILVNNTGGPPPGPIAEADDENFLTGFQNHILAASALTKVVLPGMKEARYGRIINVISTSVKVPIANLGVSNTIRGAMASWAKTLATEVAPHGVTVNNVLPGYTSTPRLAKLIESAAKRTGKTIEEAAEDWRNRVPARRFADPSEVGAAVAFLASPAAGYINGVNLPVDGGRTGCL